MTDHVFHDDVLGRLRWDADSERYEGVCQLDSAEIALQLEGDGERPSDVACQRARAFLLAAPKFLALAEDGAVEGLLELKNEAWLDGDAPVTAAEFRERMTLASVTFYDDGGMTFDYDDGDLFWGHGIVVVFNAQDECLDTDIVG